MIKKLDQLLLRNFIGPFVVTFFVALFVLVMQFLYVYMDDMIGKGLDTWILLKLMVLMAMPLVPMALPLAILLSSIMTFGSMGENFELVAIKSSGISLLRFMQPLFWFIVLVSIGAFFFMNYIVPVTNLKSYSLLYDVRQAKPAVNIKAGQFYKEIDGYTIRVGGKEKDGRTIHDVVIYDNMSRLPNAQIVVAKTGEMIPSPDKKFLVFRLRDGWRYQEGAVNNPEAKNEQTRMHFKQWDKVFDLGSFKLERSSEESFKSGQQFKNIRQLDDQLDTIQKQINQRTKSTANYLSPYLSYASTDSLAFVQSLKKKQTHSVPSYKKSITELFPDSLKLLLTQIATGNVRNGKNLIEISANDDHLAQEQRERFLIEWHRKFTLSAACIVLFLIGAPLGAIIRKGGIGLPLIFAIVFFVLYHILNRTGEQYIKGGRLNVVSGMWMATVILLPIAALMVYNAKNDASIFSKEWYQRKSKKIPFLMKKIFHAGK